MVQGAGVGKKRGLLFVILLTITGCAGGSPAGKTQTGTQGNPTMEEVGESEISAMSLGEVQFLDFGSGESTTVSFAGTSGEGTFLAVLNSNNIQEGSFNLSLGNGGSVSGLALADDLSSSEGEEDDDNPMHALVRGWAPVYAEGLDLEPVDSSVSSLQAVVIAPTVGETESFRVLNSLSSITSYTTVEARLRHAGPDVLIYVDTEMDDSLNLTDESIAELADDFEYAMPIERDFFGTESDVDTDDRITILMTPVLNRICQSNGIVTGFFFPGDLYSRSSANSASNEGEIFYTLVPDPQGDFCRPLGIDFTLKNILPGVLAHEYQHMISFNQHVFVQGGGTEKAWLNEACSHLAEDLTGYGSENYSRMKIFLDQADTTSLIPAGSPTLAERGMSYLFLRYLYEQTADATGFLNNLLQTASTGVENIEGAFPDGGAAFDEFSEMFSRWQVALVLTGTGLSNDPRYNYEPRTIDPVTGNTQGVCFHCDADDGRGTLLEGPTLQSVDSFPLTVAVQSTGMKFFRIDNPGRELLIQGSIGAQFGGALIGLEDVE